MNYWSNGTIDIVCNKLQVQAIDLNSQIYNINYEVFWSLQLSLLQSSNNAVDKKIELFEEMKKSLHIVEIKIDESEVLQYFTVAEISTDGNPQLY